MALVCAISNEVPENPVVSPVSGSVFERRLIEKYLNENGAKDPVNGEILTIDMLVEIKTPAFVKAKPPTATSIPAILKSLQDEWDAVMLHSFTLRQQLLTARQELSHALYQHDAACRVIARLTKEVTAAREALATLKPQQPLYAAGAMNDNVSSTGTLEIVGISDEIKKKLNDTASVLTQERKKKAKFVPEDLVHPETLNNYVCTNSHIGLHSVSTPGIMCLDLHGNKIVTGGQDKVVTVFDKDTEEVIASLKGHTKEVVEVVCHPNEVLVISGSVDSTVRTWHLGSNQAVQVLKAHDAAITGLSLHATGDYILTGSMDHYWAFSDLRTGTVLAKSCGEDDSSSITSAKLHPDGLIFATGTLNSNIKIWDLKEQSNVATFQGHTSPVVGISFSENGYYLATSELDSTVKLWDLRKLKNFKTITLEEGYQISDISFDNTGSYLAISGADVKIYGSKTWTLIKAFNEHKAPVTGVRFGKNASFIVSSSKDRTLKVYGIPQSTEED